MKKNSADSNYSYKDSLKKYNKPRSEKLLVFNKIIYRPVASVLVKILFRTKITPNQLTVLSFAFGILTTLFFLGGKHIYFIIGAISLQISQLLDMTDGMLARAKGTGSEFGAYLDLFLDRVTDFLIMSGIVAGYFFYSGNSTIFLIGIFSIALYFLQVTLFYITVIFIKKFKAGETEESRAALIFIILIFAIANRFDLLIFLIALETSINVLFRIGYLFKQKKTSQK